MGTLRAVFVDHTVAVGVNSLDVLPPHVSLVETPLVLPETGLPEIFQDDLLTLDRHIAWL
jgi:hypothetical protein